MVFLRVAVRETFAKFTGKYLQWIRIFSKVSGPGSQSF